MPSDPRKQKEPLDLPPPYTPTDNNASSSSSQLPTYSQQHYSHEAPVLESLQRSMDQEKRQQAPGLVESVLGLAGNIVNGITSTTTQVTHGSGQAAIAHSGKMAMDYVNSFVNDYLERKGEKQRLKESRREIKREYRQERRDLRQEIKQKRRETKRKSKADPACSSATSNTSGHSDQDIKMEKTNQPINLDSWVGNSCSLKTTNSGIRVHGSLTASEFICLEAAQGTIVIDGSLSSRQTIQAKTKNGAFVVYGDSIVTRDLKVSLTNAPIQLHTSIEADSVDLETKNAPVIVENVSIGSKLSVKSTNSPVQVHISDIRSQFSKIEIQTTNAPINVYVPSNFSGYFHVSSSTEAQVVSRSTEHLQFMKHDTKLKEGNYGRSKTDIEIHIKTTNASAILHF